MKHIKKCKKEIKKMLNMRTIPFVPGHTKIKKSQRFFSVQIPFKLLKPFLLNFIH